MKYRAVIIWLFLCSVLLANDLEGFKKNTQEGNSLFTQEEKQYLANKKVIKMCIWKDSKPIEFFENGKHQGIVGDIFTIFESYLPIPIQFIPINSFQEAQKNISNGTCDLKSIVIKESIPYQFLLTTNPYVTDQLVLITTNDKPFIDNFTESFKDKKLVVRNIAYKISLQKRYPYLKNIEVISNQNEIAELLREGYRWLYRFSDDFKPFY